MELSSSTEYKINVMDDMVSLNFLTMTNSTSSLVWLFLLTTMVKYKICSFRSMFISYFSILDILNLFEMGFVTVLALYDTFV